MTHDYKRNRTIDCSPRRTSRPTRCSLTFRSVMSPPMCLRFFKQIDASVPGGLGIRVVLDKLSAHSAPEIAKWLSRRDRGLWHLHFTQG